MHVNEGAKPAPSNPEAQCLEQVLVDAAQCSTVDLMSDWWIKTTMKRVFLTALGGLHCAQVLHNFLCTYLNRVS